MKRKIIMLKKNKKLNGFKFNYIGKFDIKFIMKKYVN